MNQRSGDFFAGMFAAMCFVVVFGLIYVIYAENQAEKAARQADIDLVNKYKRTWRK